VSVNKDEDVLLKKKNKGYEMIYPQGETIYQNLSTEYTDLPQLLSTLKPKGFSGIVEVEVTGKKGVFFMVSGDVINAAFDIENDPPAIIGEEATQKLFAISSRNNGILNVYQAPSIEVEFAANALVKTEPLFKDLSTDFVKIDQFIKKLQDEKFTGYMEIFIKKNQSTGKLSIKAGETAGLQIISRSGSPSFFEKEMILPTLEESVKQGATFNVYRSKGLSMPVKEIKKAVAEPTVEPADVGKEFKPESFIDLNADIKEEEIFDLKLPEKQQIPIARKPDVGEKLKDENGTGNGRNEFLAALQRIFVKIEKFVDSVSEQGGFQRTFKKACIEKSDSYHFLDPFEGQFDYQGKKIRLDATVETEEFTRAIAECLNLTLSYIRKELPKNVVFPPGLKADVESVFKKRPDLAGTFTF